MVVAEVPVLALVAVTVIGKEPVPDLLLPPHPASGNMSARLTSPAATLTRTRLLRQSAAEITANPSSNSHVGEPGGGLPSRGGKAEPLAAATVTVMVTCVLKVVVDEGLKAQVAPAGSPLQEKVMAPSPLLESTLKVVEVVPPRVT